VSILLYRAVSAAELADILGSGEYRLLPGGVEGKYFCLSLDDARYFRDQALLEAMAIVCSLVSETTEALLDRGVFDQRPGVFANLLTLPMVNADARRFGGIPRLE
jgi:hypothetical protein